MKKLFVLLLTAMFVTTGCVGFHDEPTKSVWSEGLWILPWALGIAATVCYFFFWKSKRTGWTQQTKDGIKSGDEKTKGQLWYLYAALMLTGAFIAVILVTILQR